MLVEQHFACGVIYDGSAFHGWQRQVSEASVQGELEAAFSQVADHPVSLIAAGRTDAGVHATGQVVHFSSRASRQPQQWLRGTNALTSSALRIHWVVEVDASFHARYKATARRYTYVYHDNATAQPLLHGRVWECPALDADAMHRAAQDLLGEHDFSSFRAAGCQSLTALRRVHRCEVTRRGAFVVMEIEANAFLLHMVRNIARALHDVGIGRLKMPLRELLALRDRTRLGATAPPHGLYLSGVEYGELCLPAAAPVPFAGLT